MASLGFWCTLFWSINALFLAFQARSRALFLRLVEGDFFLLFDVFSKPFCPSKLDGAGMTGLVSIGSLPFFSVTWVFSEFWRQFRVRQIPKPGYLIGSTLVLHILIPLNSLECYKGPPVVRQCWQWPKPKKFQTLWQRFSARVSPP